MSGRIRNTSFLFLNGRKIRRVPTELNFADRLGSWKARWGIGRMKYVVEPGLYAVGNPNSESPVLVTANYRMSFDRLRSNLGGRDAWILVLDTKGINVWCAAGKGTFGTEELVRRIEAVSLKKIVDHRNLVLPQLGATGVSAHLVKKLSGFRVIYGPVRADDLPAFMDAGMQATREMRRVRFTMLDRIVLAPIELVVGGKYALIAAAAFFLLAGVNRAGYSSSLAVTIGLPAALILLMAFVVGGVLGVILLPWLPGRAFAAKGMWLGLAIAVGVTAYGLQHMMAFGGWLSLAAWMLIMPAITSYMLMNFTGASTYTSLSGVLREIRVAVPLQSIGAGVGVALWLAGRFV